MARSSKRYFDHLFVIYYIIYDYKFIIIVNGEGGSSQQRQMVGDRVEVTNMMFRSFFFERD